MELFTLPKNTGLKCLSVEGKSKMRYKKINLNNKRIYSNSFNNPKYKGLYIINTAKYLYVFLLFMIQIQIKSNIDNSRLYYFYPILKVSQ